ncbi:erythromycin esterase family protein [Salinarimonas rosea]|uniref:erythromycin esterase family protein n=1 Tax=Salinarimonas rosea TaxID=552063 RepID=UPI000424723F|nr:erythromycin esterase family protein [Salinarimonas rosea]
MQRPDALSTLILEEAEPLPPVTDTEALGRAFDRFGDARVVLIGEASHGTADFYEARAAITRHLIAHHGFDFVAIEGDWPDVATLDAHVRDRPGGMRETDAFRRFPTWMWRNASVARFVAWLRAHNAGRPPEARVSMHGLDIYSLDASMAAVVDYLDEVDPEAAEVARERYGCLMRWRNDPARYGRAALSAGYPLCEEAVAAMLTDLLGKRLAYLRDGGEDFLDAAQNARLVQAAERYYRIMYYGGAESWNLRDTHMAETLERLLARGDGGRKGIVWAHNSHIHDARAADMGRTQGEVSLGQLARERHGDDAVLIGLGTDRGTVAAASDWDEPMEVMKVTPSRPGSVERAFADTGAERLLLDLRRASPALADALAQERPERFIGVIYRPRTELASHYMDASLATQFDAWIWLAETRAVTPLPRDAGAGAAQSGPDETWPFGL